MKLAALLRPPVRPLLAERPRRVVFTTGSLGYLDAAEDDRRRWIRGFRALLDGLSAPLQVLIRVGGSPGPIVPRREAAASSPTPPSPGERRRLDLDFARSLRRAPEAQRRQVVLVTAPGAAMAVERGLAALGLAATANTTKELGEDRRQGSEAPGSWWDGEGLHRTWYVDRFPGGDLEPGWLLRLIPAELDVSLSWHAERLPADWVVAYLQRQLVRLRASEMSGPEVGDPAVAGALPAAEILQQRVAAREESAFRVGLYLTVSTHGPRELADAGQRIEAAARAALCALQPCTFRQLDGRLATLPAGVDPLGRCRILDTSSLSTFFPWFDADLQESGGLVVGTSRATGQPVLIDPFDETRYANANIGVFGHSGAGKTYLLSTLAMSAGAAGAQVFVIDPEHEYGPLAERLGGIDVRLALGTPHALNVLDLRGGSREEEVVGPAAADTADLCAILCGGLDEAERAALEAAARATFEHEREPTLRHVATRLGQDTRAAQVLGRWSHGSLGRIFSSPTTIDLEAPIVVFGMRELRPEMVAPVHFLLAEALWARIKQRDRRRTLIIDELGLLFEDATIRRFVVALARRIRKYHGSLVFATQNPGDLLSSEAGAVVATNPAIHFFGAQRPGEAARLQAHFELSDRQRVTMESAGRGEFLLAAAADRIPLKVRASPWQAALMKASRPP